MSEFIGSKHALDSLAMRTYLPEVTSLYFNCKVEKKMMGQALF